MMNVHQEISKIRAFRERNGNDGEIKPFVGMFREGELLIDFYSLRLHRMKQESPDNWDPDLHYKEAFKLFFSDKAGFKHAYRLARLVTRIH